MKNRGIKVYNKTIGDGQPVFIIAEAGVNHNGDIDLAKKMIKSAKKAGADAVKFQTFITEELVTKDASKTDYQKNVLADESQFDMLKKLELSESDFQELFLYCKKNQLIFLSTPFDFRSVEILDGLGVSAFKISSSDLNNIPLILKIARYMKPIILSTGMADLTEVKKAIETVYSTGNHKLILLHCTSNYPVKYEDVNLRAMQTLQKEFNFLVGYSDHTLGIEVPVAAVAMGACVVEKHFTLNTKLSGPDHSSSLEPDEFKRMVNSIRNIERAIGSWVKKPAKSESKIKRLVRKSVVAATDIPEGTILSEEMLSLKRPGTGIEPEYYSFLIGRKTGFFLKKNQLIEWNLLE